jgi:hypothetical protein
VAHHPPGVRGTSTFAAVAFEPACGSARGRRCVCGGLLCSMAAFCSLYVFKQTFAIPGSVLLNVAAGAVFGSTVGACGHPLPVARSHFFLVPAPTPPPHTRTPPPPPPPPWSATAPSLWRLPTCCRCALGVHPLHLRRLQLLPAVRPARAVLRCHQGVQAGRRSIPCPPPGSVTPHRKCCAWLVSSRGAWSPARGQVLAAKAQGIEEKIQAARQSNQVQPPPPP